MPLGGGRNGRSGPGPRLAGNEQDSPENCSEQLGELRDTQVLEDVG